MRMAMVKNNGYSPITFFALAAMSIIGIAAIYLISLTIDTSQASSAWTSPQMISEFSYSSYLPGIAVGPDNALHVTWTGNTLAHYSKNSGSAWSSPYTPGYTANDWPSSVAVDGQGRVFLAWQEPKNDAGVDSSDVYIKCWNGTTWTVPINVSQSPGVWSKNPVIAADGAGTVHIAWTEGDPGNIYYQNWNGKYWADEDPVWSAIENISNQGWGSWNPSISVDSAGTPRIAWGESPSEYGGEALILYRERNGGTWGTVRDVSHSLPGGLYSMPKLTVDTAGNSHLLVRIFTTKLDLYYTHSEDAGTHWAAATNLSEADSGHALNSTIAVDSDGIVHAAWTRSADMMATYGDAILYVNGSGGGFTAPAAVNMPAGANKFRGASLATDSLDRVHLVYDAQPREPGVSFGAVFYTQLPWRFAVTAPNGGETINGATNATAAGRGANNVVRYASFYVTDGIFTDIIGNDDTPDDGWMIPWDATWTPPGNNYRIVAYGLDSFFGIAQTDESNGPFSVTNTTVFPTLEVIKPVSTAAGHDRIGGASTQLKARVTGDTQDIVDKVIFYYHQNGGAWISLGLATQSGDDWNLDWNVTSLPDGDGYQILAKARHDDGSVYGHLVATAFSNIFEVRNAPIVSIWNQAGQALGGWQTLYIRKDWDPNNRVSYAILSQTHGGGSGGMGWAYAAPSGNPCESGGYTCLQFNWNTTFAPEYDDYAITADAYNASDQLIATTTKSPFIVQNGYLKFTKPAAGATVGWPIETAVRPRADISDISPAHFFFQCGDAPNPRISLNTPDAGRPYAADFDPGTISSCAASGHLDADYTQGGNPYTATVGGLSAGPGFTPTVNVTPGSTDPAHPYFITAETVLSATFTAGWDPVPPSEILSARLIIEGYNNGMHVTQMSDDLYGSDGWSWTAADNGPDFVDGNYDAYIDIYWKAAPSSPHRVWHGYYVVNKNYDPAVVTTESLPGDRQRMRQAYHFRYTVHNPDQIPQSVQLTLAETGGVNSIANDWFNFSYTTVDYHDKVNGVAKTSDAISWTQTATIPAGQYYTFDFPVNHEWKWLEPGSSETFDNLDILFKMNDIAGLIAAGSEDATFIAQCENIGLIGNAIQVATMISQVTQGAVAMDYDYQLSTNISGMTGYTGSYSLINRIPDGKVVLLFDSYTANILAGSATAGALAFTACPPCSITLAVTEAINWGIAYEASRGAADPDPLYQTTDRPPEVTLSEVDNLVEGVGKDAARATLDSYNSMHYLGSSMARLEAAETAGDKTWEARQLDASLEAAQELTARLQAQSDAQKAFYEQLASMGIDVTVDAVAQAQQQIKDDGSLPADEISILSRMGFSPGQIEGMEQGFLLSDPEEIAKDDEVASGVDKMIEQHDDLINDLTDKRDSLEKQNYYFTWYDEQSPGMKNWILGANPGSAISESELDIFTAGNQRNTLPYVLPPGDIVTPHFPDVMEGPVRVVSRFGQSQIVSQRILYGDSFEEVLGLEEERLSDHYYYSWYDEYSAGSHNWILVANPSATDEAEVEITITNPEDPGGAPLIHDQRTLAPGEIMTPQYTGVIGGPVEVIAFAPGDRDTPRLVLTSQRVLWQGRFNEVPGVAGGELSNEYLWTWYDESVPGIQDWVLIANPNNFDIKADIFIGNHDTPVWSTDGLSGRPNAIAPDGIVTPRFPGEIDGPVTVRTWKDENRQVPAMSIASQRSLWGASFEEVPGLPPAQLTASTNFSWYDQQSTGSLNWVLVANPGGTAAKVEVWIAGEKRATLEIAPGGRETPTFPGVMSGPVEIRAYDASTYNPEDPGLPNHPVMASQRVLWNGNFNEVLGVSLE